MDLGGGRRLWRQEAGSKMLWKKSRERSSLWEANESVFAQYSSRMIAVEILSTAKSSRSYTSRKEHLITLSFQQACCSERGRKTFYQRKRTLNSN